jgi:hypothetical protein
LQIIGAPAFFPTVWGWIKRWFDPITVSKIFILSSSNVKSTLEKYIDPANIPKKYGGELDFEFGMMPVPEPSIEQSIIWENPATQNGHKTFPIGPIRWIEEDGEVKAIAVGSEDGKPRRVTVARLPKGASIRASQNVANTPLNEAELSYLDTGVSTQPPDNGEEPNEVPPASSSGTNTPAVTTEPTSGVSSPKHESNDGVSDVTTTLATTSLDGKAKSADKTEGEKTDPEKASAASAGTTAPTALAS